MMRNKRHLPLSLPITVSFNRLTGEATNELGMKLILKLSLRLTGRLSPNDNLRLLKPELVGRRRRYLDVHSFTLGSLGLGLSELVLLVTVLVLRRDEGECAGCGSRDGLGEGTREVWVAVDDGDWVLVVGVSSLSFSFGFWV